MATTNWQEQIRAPHKRATTFSSLLIIFLLTILLPISLEVVGLRLSPNRLFLLIFSVPFALKVLQGRAGRFTLVDTLFLLAGFWIMLSLVVVHGTGRIPFAGITVVELVGGYFAGRALIRDAQDYKAMIKFMLIAMICLLPFALVESITGRLILPELFSIIFDAPSRANSAYGRLGLERVYSVFHHPILFGLFCSIALANVLYLFSGRSVLAMMAALLAIGMSFMSLSSAPLIACGVQIGLLIWNRMMHGRWLLLLTLTVTAYVAVDLASNRTPIIIIIETLTFNPGTGWTRIATNRYGWDSVWNYPIFGLGFNDWVRPDWLTPSVDNFWLVMAMRYGFVGFSLIALACLLHLLALARTSISREDVNRCRTAYGIVLVSTCFTLITVHIWDTMSAFVMFFIGAGAWIYTSDCTNDETEVTPATRTEPRYTRFEQGEPQITEQDSQKRTRR